jgi:hypothetical protein
MTLSHSLNFELPPWPDDAFKTFNVYERRFKSVAEKAGSGSDKFKQSCYKIKSAFENIASLNFNDVFAERIDIRAFTYLLTNDQSFSENLLIDREILDALLVGGASLTKSSLLRLINAYLASFDELTNAEGLVYWSLFIQKQLSEYESKPNTNQLTRYAKNKTWIFSENGPRNLSQRAQNAKVDLDSFIKSLGIKGIVNSRFLTLARYQYYLKQLETMNVGEDHKLLSELVKKDVFSARFDGGLSLGHEIITIMIDRSEGHQLSDSWQRVILSIAGDPRVPKSSEKYKRWWVILGEKRIALMRGWLSRFDLSLFLKVLEQSAKDGRNDDMERMFTPRKAFIEGLEKTGVISESRLFLSRYAERYLKKHYRKDELPNYARVTSQDTSMIYLNIENKVHMIEGSHSFTLKLMQRLPAKCSVTDYRIKEISNDSLRTMVAYQYRKEFNTEKGLIELRHDPHLNWQHNAIVFFRNAGIKLNFSNLIAQKELRNYKNKFGV